MSYLRILTPACLMLLSGCKDKDVSGDWTKSNAPAKSRHQERQEQREAAGPLENENRKLAAKVLLLEEQLETERSNRGSNVTIAATRENLEIIARLYMGGILNQPSTESDRAPKWNEDHAWLKVVVQDRIAIELEKEHGREAVGAWISAASLSVPNPATRR